MRNPDEIGTQRNGERGENNAKRSHLLTDLHFDAGFKMKKDITLLLHIALTKFWRRWQVKIASYIVRAESKKGSPS